MTNLMHKKLRYQLIFSRDIVHQKILRSDWARATTGHIQLKVVVSDATFP